MLQPPESLRYARVRARIPTYCLRRLLLPRAAARCFGAQPADAASMYCCHLVVVAAHTSTYCCFLLLLLMPLMFFVAAARYHR